MLLFAPTLGETEAHRAYFHAFLEDRGLTLNPDKEALTAPGEGWTCLGFFCQGDRVDIAPATVEKLKGKMRRKTRALLRWADRTGAEGERAAAAFIRVFNRKLLESAGDNELTWAYWFFSAINTDRSLAAIDRRLVSGRNTKARYNVRYADLKALGYRSLVNAYYAFRSD